MVRAVYVGITRSQALLGGIAYAHLKTAKLKEVKTRST